MKLGANDVNNFAVGSNGVDAIYLGDDNVWTAYDGAPSPLIITESGDYVAGIDFPANVELSICMVGGGGSGSNQQNVGLKGAGYSGEVISTTISFDKFETVEAIIGSGGAGLPTAAWTNGNAGEDTTFANITATGGGGGVWNVGYLGAGEPRTTCGGTFNDGTMIPDATFGNVYGGEASSFAKGGNSGTTTPSQAGQLGSGSGATKGNPTGAGGSGQIVISWE